MIKKYAIKTKGILEKMNKLVLNLTKDEVEILRDSLLTSKNHCLDLIKKEKSDADFIMELIGSVNVYDSILTTIEDNYDDETLLVLELNEIIMLIKDLSVYKSTKKIPAVLDLVKGIDIDTIERTCYELMTTNKIIFELDKLRNKAVSSKENDKDGFDIANDLFDGSELKGGE